MLIAVLILSVVVLIEAYIIVEKESRIIYLRKRLLKQIRMTDSLKSQLANRNIRKIEDITFHKAWGVDMDEERKNKIREELMKIDKEGRFIPVSMPIEMTEVKNEAET